MCLLLVWVVLPGLLKWLLFCVQLCLAFPCGFASLCCFPSPAVVRLLLCYCRLLVIPYLELGRVHAPAAMPTIVLCFGLAHCLALACWSLSAFSGVAGTSGAALWCQSYFSAMWWFVLFGSFVVPSSFFCWIWCPSLVLCLLASWLPMRFPIIYWRVDFSWSPQGVHTRAFECRVSGWFPLYLVETPFPALIPVRRAGSGLVLRFCGSAPIFPIVTPTLHACPEAWAELRALRLVLATRQQH